MISKHAVSGYVGVQPKRGKWQAILQYKGKVYRLGIYEEIEDAIEARRKAKEKESTSTGHKILTTLGIVLCIILIPILIINCTLIIKSYTNKDEVPSVGGIGYRLS